MVSSLGVGRSHVGGAHRRVKNKKVQSWSRKKHVFSSIFIYVFYCLFILLCILLCVCPHYYQEVISEGMERRPCILIRPPSRRISAIVKNVTKPTHAPHATRARPWPADRAFCSLRDLIPQTLPQVPKLAEVNQHWAREMGETTCEQLAHSADACMRSANHQTSVRTMRECRCHSAPGATLQSFGGRNRCRDPAVVVCRSQGRAIGCGVWPVLVCETVLAWQQRKHS